MLSAQSRRADVCGVTIESCHDHSETTGTPAAFSTSALRPVRNALRGRISAKATPFISHACMLPECGVPMVTRRRTRAPPNLRK